MFAPTTLNQHDLHAPADSVPTTLAAQHALLLAAVTARSVALLVEVDQDRWPQRELLELVDYLHLELLRQFVDEEWLLFRNSHHDPQGLAQLREDHLELRFLIEVLTDAAAHRGQLPPERVAAATQDLLTRLRTHLRTEMQVLRVDAEPCSTAALGRTPHTWYGLTKGPLIDMDTLPGPRGVDAVMSRIMRLRSGEQLDLVASNDPLPIWRRLASVDPGGYGFCYRQHGPPQWRVQVTRHAAS